MSIKKTPHFYHFLAEANIACGMKARTGAEAIVELAIKLEKTTAGLKAEPVIKAVMDREKIMPTIIAPGLAVPHARLDDIDRIVVALGISSQGIDFNMPSMPPVNVVILILTPKSNPAIHLQVISALGKDFKDEKIISRLIEIQKPEEVIQFFSLREQAIPDYLQAKDLLNGEVVTLSESDTLGKAIDTFALKRVMDIPIIDEEKDVRGIISYEDILRLSLPEHLLWMNDLSPIMYFQPFAETLKKEKDTKIADFMREDFIAIDETVPAIQLARIFLMRNTRMILVTQNSKFVGAVDMSAFITKIFWA